MLSPRSPGPKWRINEYAAGVGSFRNPTEGTIFVVGITRYLNIVTVGNVDPAPMTAGVAV